MCTKNPFHFDYSYVSLPETFYSLVKPSTFSAPTIFLLNEKLCEELNISKNHLEDYIASLKDEKLMENSFAQAYAGHQFGYFTILGDGRAIILGEHITDKNERFDIQIKGSGRTRYSRQGDGKATLKSMLREYLISEAMFYLKVPSSRSLAVIKTGESVHREILHQGAALIRVMKSHVRVGTFEYAAHLGSTDNLKALVQYSIKRLYPEIEQENSALSLLKKVMDCQIELVVNWLRVGFIHGVMNTDNTAISGETFDYGPCAFINAYHPDTVFSSIDHYGRYAFGNQAKIMKWNLARFAESLLPVLHQDEKKALELAQMTIDGFDEVWREQFYGTMLKKIGLEHAYSEDFPLVDELLEWMQKLKMDYTNTFLEMAKEGHSEARQHFHPDVHAWLKKWRNRIDSSCGLERARAIMKDNNPVYIPRNNLVEQALAEAINGNSTLFERLLSVLSKPYHYQDNLVEYMQPSDFSFERTYQTFCGT